MRCSQSHHFWYITPVALQNSHKIVKRGAMWRIHLIKRAYWWYVGLRVCSFCVRWYDYLGCSLNVWCSRAHFEYNTRHICIWFGLNWELSSFSSIYSKFSYSSANHPDTLLYHALLYLAHCVTAATRVPGSRWRYARNFSSGTTVYVDLETRQVDIKWGAKQGSKI